MEGLPGIIAVALLKGLLYASLIVLLGVEAFRRLLAPPLGNELRRTLRGATGLAALALVSLSAIHVVVVLRQTLGFLEAGILLEYAAQSLHGRASIARIALVATLAGFAYLPGGRRWTVAWLGAGVGTLATFSAISHNASMPDRWAAPADLLHLAAATAWGGAVLAAAFLPVWAERHRAALETAMVRLSAVGVTAVAVLFVTGIYSAQLHIGEPEAVLTTRYGWALVLKNVLVLVILCIAALNRWVFLPALRRDGPTPAFSRALRVEAVLLLAVLGATGWLTTSPMPH